MDDVNRIAGTVMAVKILKNAAQCKVCGEIVESHAVHEMVECSCGELAVDGGLSYIRRVVDSISNMVELSEVEGDPAEVQVLVITSGKIVPKTLQELRV